MIPSSAFGRKKLLASIKAISEEMDKRDCDMEALDDAVHECASARATEVNNNGREGQLEYLLRNGWRHEDILQRTLP